MAPRRRWYLESTASPGRRYSRRYHLETNHARVRPKDRQQAGDTSSQVHTPPVMVLRHPWLNEAGNGAEQRPRDLSGQDDGGVSTESCVASAPSPVSFVHNNFYILALLLFYTARHPSRPHPVLGPGKSRGQTLPASGKSHLGSREIRNGSSSLGDPLASYSHLGFNGNVGFWSLAQGHVKRQAPGLLRQFKPTPSNVSWA